MAHTIWYLQESWTSLTLHRWGLEELCPSAVPSWWCPLEILVMQVSCSHNKDCGVQYLGTHLYLIHAQQDALVHLEEQVSGHLDTPTTGV